LNAELLMLRNYLKVLFRNMRKDSFFSLINIFGLSIGMAACFFIFQYVYFESNYDHFNINSDRIYRVAISYSDNSEASPPSATNHPAVGPAMKADLPEVEDFARIVHSTVFMTAGSMISYKDREGNMKHFNEDRIYLADPSFLDIFSVPFIYGDSKNALSQPMSIALSKSTSEKYFGEGNSVGKTLVLNGKKLFVVSGVFKDIPENSHINFEMLISLKFMGENFGYNNWTWPEFYSYVLLEPDADPKKLERYFPRFLQKYMGEIMRSFNFTCQLHLQPITDIHLKSTYTNEPEPPGSAITVRILAISGVFVLLIAWINYINLSTAKSIERGLEVALRKVFGAKKSQLFLQFYVEALITSLLALLLAIIIVVTSFGLYIKLIGKNLGKAASSEALWKNENFWEVSGSIFLAGILIIGSASALKLAKLNPAALLKGKLGQLTTGISLRKVLVSFQFTLAVLLLGGTISVYNQLSFMRNRELGYSRDQILTVKAPIIKDSTFITKAARFKSELDKTPLITNVTWCSEIPGKVILARNNVWKVSEDEKNSVSSYLMEIDENFIPTLKIEILNGRNFISPDSSNVFKNTSTKVLINEKLRRTLLFKNNEEALDQNIYFRTQGRQVHGQIVGIVKNYHQRSLHEDYEPILYYYPNWNNWQYLAIHVNMSNLDQTLSTIESSYKELFPGNAFDFFFLDEYLNYQYKDDQVFGKVLSLFTFLAALVACLGLLGLSNYAIKIRGKEIGIRKLLGATIGGIVILFFKDFLRLVLLATIIATPIVYFVGNRWLNNYAFRTDLGWPVFVIPPLLLLVITFITISIQSAKAALTNPAATLRMK